jgi:chromosomal replication initiator protein
MADQKWDYSSAWQEAVRQIAAEISEQEFLMWFRNMGYAGAEQSRLFLRVPSSFYKDQIQQRYLRLIEDKLHELLGNPIQIDFRIEKPSAAPLEPTEPAKADAEAPRRKPARRAAGPQLNDKYVFENFVVGENNSFAANAAYAIAKNPGTTYNPCLIYGGVGLGKTHLIQAIGNAAFTDFPEMKVVYVTAETFTNEFIVSIKERTNHLFKRKYRSVDLLLIDDIHLFQGKAQTQEELFYTFEALYNANKQMVFTCDRPVSELRELTDRLRSRFERGLNVDLQPPSYETRVAILRKKIEEQHVEIPEDVVELICRNVTTNVRDLEAALTKIVAYANLVSRNVTLDTAQQLLRDVFASPRQKSISVEIVQRVVSEYFGLSQSDLKGKKRTKAIAFPRQMAMYLAREMTEYSTTELGIEFGGRDHTTIMYGCQKIENRIKTDSTLEPIISGLKRSIREYGANT